MTGTLRTYGLLTIAMIAIDQAIKYAVETRMVMHEAIEIVPFLALYRTHNTGISFSLMAGQPTLVLVALMLAVISFVGYLAWKSESHQTWARIGFALIIGGALGNLIDRVWLGYVVDYVLFHTPSWSFAVFNLADACISVGAFLVILQEFVDWRRHRQGQS